MTLSKILFHLVFFVSYVSGHLLSAEPMTRVPTTMGAQKLGKKTFTRTEDRGKRSIRSEKKVKIIDFSVDIDGEPDNSNEYTSATLNAGPLSKSFTICMGFMVEAWTSAFTSAKMFSLQIVRYDWISVNLLVCSNITTYEVKLGPVIVKNQTGRMLFPLQWTRICLSLDSIEKTFVTVADGKLLGHKQYRSEADLGRPLFRPVYLNLELGFDPVNKQEYTGRVSGLNIFSVSSPKERMVDLTTAGGKECGSPGDLVNWEEAEWTLHSKAKVIEVDREWEGPCRRESQVQVFTADFKHHKGCMHHCQKISGGRSPPVNNEEDWESLTKEVDLITQDPSNLPTMWLSATEGDKNNRLQRLDHWPQTELVDNETLKLEAGETVWRDFFTGQRLENWTLPYYDGGWDEASKGETFNCMAAYTDLKTMGRHTWLNPWHKRECESYGMSCPCSYPSQPLLRLRGLCSPLIDRVFTPKQLFDESAKIIMVGQMKSRIEHNNEKNQWMLTDAKSNLTAMSSATMLSYAQSCKNQKSTLKTSQELRMLSGSLSVY